LRGEISPLNAEAAPPFCHSSWEDKQMKGSTKEIPMFLNYFDDNRKDERR